MCDTNGRIEINTLENNQVVAKEDIKNAHKGSIWQLAWSHPIDGNILASCGYDQRIILWKKEADGWKSIYEFTDEEGSVNTIAWAPREYGQILVSGNSCGTVSIYKYSGGSWEQTKLKKHKESVNSITFGPATYPTILAREDDNSGKTPPLRFVSVSCDKSIIEWTQDATTSDRQIGTHDDWVRDAAWAPNVGMKHDLLATCSESGVKIWKRDAEDWEEMKSLDVGGAAWRVCWSPTGNMLTVTTGENKTVMYRQALGSDDWEFVSSMDEGSIVEN